MPRFLLRRLGFAIPLLLGVVTLVFLLGRIVPGDPVDIMLGESAPAADREALRRSLGLNKPLIVQYGDYVAGLASGDLGTSTHYGRPVAELIRERFPATAQLTVAALLVALLLALPLGLLSAAAPGTVVDHGSRFLAMLGISMPHFWLGPLLMLAFSVHWQLFPLGGRGTLLHLVLPAVTLGTALAAILSRMIRSSVLDTMREEYIRVARAKGLAPWRVLLVHALRNALIPVVTILGLQFGALLSGSIITETVFSWPGVGMLVIQSILSRDYPLLQGCVVVLSVCYLVVNLATDIAYGVVDPRVRHA
jgi:peptide/nickel transport system permease protein